MIGNSKTLRDANLDGKKVFIRADLNVPIDDNGKVTDLHRVKEFIPTLQLVREKGGIPILASHLGRPTTKREPQFSLAPVARAISDLLSTEVVLAPDCIGNEVKSLADNLKSGQILCLENLRYHKGESDNNPEFSAQLASLAEVYINDAFGTAHRAHASVVGVPKIIKESLPGLLLQKELDYYRKALINPERPLCVVIGGAKVSSKLGALKNLISKADKFIIGGAMANTFLAAQGMQMGRSLYEPSLLTQALEITGTLARRGCQLYLPVDLIVAPNLKSKGFARAVPVQEVPADCMALDIGPASRILFQEAIQTVSTVVWNGPMGAFEEEDFAAGTESMVESLAAAHAMTVVGGGDTDAAINKLELAHKFDFISTGGGAFLELLEGKPLPAFTALGIDI